MRWTKVDNVRPFLVGLVRSADRSGVRYSLHLNGREAWVVVRAGNDAEVYGPVVFNRAKKVYNDLLSR